MIFIIIGIIVVILIVLYFIFRPKPPVIEKAERILIKMAGNKVSVENINKLNSKTFEFDVYADGTNFEITSHQMIFGFNQALVQTGTSIFEYISGTCETTNPPIYGLGINAADGSKELTCATGPGSDIINSKKRLGKFRLKKDVDFPPNEELNLSWNFSGKINTIFTGANFVNITSTILFNIIIGDINMITINDNQKVLLTAEPVSAKGNPAPLDGAVVWTVPVGAQFVTIVTKSDLTAEVSAVGPIGVATVVASADAELGSGTTQITNTIDIEVVGGQAVTLNIIAGTPVSQ